MILSKNVDVESQILAHFDSSPLIQNSKFNHFLWVCWFLCKTLSNFVSLVWKLHNPYCHIGQWCISYCNHLETPFCIMHKMSHFGPHYPNGSSIYILASIVTFKTILISAVSSFSLHFKMKLFQKYFTMKAI